MLRTTIILLALVGLVFGLAKMPAQSHFAQNTVVGSVGDFLKINFQSCTTDICIEIKADKAVQSIINGGIAFTNANVHIQNVSLQNKIAQFQGTGFYDAKSEHIFFTEIINSKFKEAYFDKRTGKFVKL